MAKVKRDLLRLVCDNGVEFEEDQFAIWFGKSWQRKRDANGIIRCSQW